MENEFDLEAFDREWEETQQAEGAVTEEQPEVVEGDNEVDPNQEYPYNMDDEPEVKAPEEATAPAIHDTDEAKRNAAFAELRRERDEAKKQADFLKRIADDSGLSVEEIVKRYEESKLAEQAEAQGVPVEVMQRLQQQEQELEALKHQSFSERFNTQVENTVEKYKASKEDVEKTFKYAADNGLIQTMQAGNLNFEAVHKMAHMDTLIEKQVQTALQYSLDQKKKRQTEAPLAHTQASASTESLEEMAIRDAAKIMEDGGF